MCGVVHLISSNFTFVFCLFYATYLPICLFTWGTNSYCVFGAWLKSDCRLFSGFCFAWKRLRREVIWRLFCGTDMKRWTAGIHLIILNVIAFAHFSYMHPLFYSYRNFIFLQGFLFPQKEKHFLFLWFLLTDVIIISSSSSNIIVYLFIYLFLSILFYISWYIYLSSLFLFLVSLLDFSLNLFFIIRFYLLIFNLFVLTFMDLFLLIMFNNLSFFLSLFIYLFIYFVLSFFLSSLNQFFHAIQ